MKAVLISIQPKWVEKIAQGKKTVEVRKTKPKIDVPFKCYIYCTKDQLLTRSHYDGKIYIAWKKSHQQALEACGNQTLSGKVVGEFVCDSVDEYTFSNLEAEYRINDIDIAKTCLNHPELIGYGEGKPLYGWHISDLKIYDKPKELDDFWRECKEDCKCDDCPSHSWDCEIGDECATDGFRRITRPPQSWCYVEEL